MVCENKKIHIVYASDDNFADIMGISIVSLFENNKEMDEINIYILDGGITAENKKKLDSISEKYNRSSFTYIEVSKIMKELDGKVSTDRGSLSQYARIFVSSTLPQNIKRVLYLDCDTIIVSSLCELWNIDMKGHTIAALMDAFSVNYRQNIGLKGKDIMFNSGVMLIDLDKWKEHEIEKKLLRFISKRKGVIQQGDQGALNAVLSHDTFCFDPKFNSETVFYDFNYQEMMIYRDPPEFYSEKEIVNAVHSPVIIHFTTSFLSERPWVKGSRHIYRNKWLSYKKKSPWADAPMREPKKEKIVKRIYLEVIGRLPRRSAVLISGLLHRYGRPFLFKMILIIKGI